MQSSSSSLLSKDQGSPKHLAAKPNYKVKEQIKNGTKYFLCLLYMPDTCRKFLKRIKPEKAFVKKKDAENHVALLALKKLHERNSDGFQYLNDNLFPVNLVNYANSASDSISTLQSLRCMQFELSGCSSISQKGVVQQN